MYNAGEFEVLPTRNIFTSRIPQATAPVNMALCAFTKQKKSWWLEQFYDFMGQMLLTV